MTAEQCFEFLVWREWWRYRPGADWYQQPYHWLNLIEGAIWLGVAGWVLIRWRRERRSSWLEPLYTLSFILFALTDFREALAVHSGLILLKGFILAAILILRNAVRRARVRERGSTLDSAVPRERSENDHAIGPM